MGVFLYAAINAIVPPVHLLPLDKGQTVVLVRNNEEKA